MSVQGGVCLGMGYVCPGGLPGGWGVWPESAQCLNRITDRSKNITFPQLLLRTVITYHSLVRMRKIDFSKYILKRLPRQCDETLRVRSHYIRAKAKMTQFAMGLFNTVHPPIPGVVTY